ncbi:unnamed protein product [Caretta caretta]
MLPWEDQQVTYISILLLSDLWIEIFILEVRCNSLDIAEEKKPEEEKASKTQKEPELRNPTQREEEKELNEGDVK